VTSFFSELKVRFSQKRQACAKFFSVFGRKHLLIATCFEKQCSWPLTTTPIIEALYNFFYVSFDKIYVMLLQCVILSRIPNVMQGVILRLKYIAKERQTPFRINPRLETLELCWRKTRNRSVY